jgi:DNA ligase-1
MSLEVFDIPSLEESPVEERWQFLRDYFASNPSEHVQVVPAEKCQGNYTSYNHCSLCEGVKHLEEKLKEVESGGGEGLVLRAPGSLYERKR